MDLSFRFPDPAAAGPPAADAAAAEVAAIDLAPLIAMLEARQSASATAQARTELDDANVVIEAPLAPTHGAFNAGMAARLEHWRADAAAGDGE